MEEAAGDDHLVVIPGRPPSPQGEGAASPESDNLRANDLNQVDIDSGLAGCARAPE